MGIMEEQQTLTECFDQIVSHFRDKVAVTAEDGELTYRELSRRADQLARTLQDTGARPGSIVALLVPRSTHLITGILGILRAGAAYLPIDPSYPPERISWIIEDSGASAVVSVSTLSDKIPDQKIDLVLADQITERPADQASQRPAASGNDLAYIIYTSGSTGTPKGVQVEHRNVIRLFGVTREQFSFDENDIWTLFHSAAFDFSVWEMWGALLFGGRLVVVPSEVAQDPREFLRLLHEQRVTVLNQTPSAFGRLAAGDALREQRLAHLRVVIFGGERLEPRTLHDWMDRYGDESPRLVNMYGITEATVHASYHRLTRADLAAGGPSPIGHPLPDLAFHVLDEDGAPVTAGQPGELHIAGAGVSRGYLRRPDLTAERFTTLTDSSGRGHRCYRTGDRVVALGAGGYGYLGRTDDQLKIRGYRVEPGEVEAVIAGHPGVSAAVVTSHDYGCGDVRLIAYVVPRSAGGAPAAELGQLAAEFLPPHLRPSGYVTLPELPLTVNGKTDRTRLPAPTRETALAPASASTPDDSALSDTERRISRIWQDVLQVPRVGTDVDFFDLGGTSLSLLRMFNQVNEEFRTDLDITVLIDGATVEVLARNIDRSFA